MYSEANVSTVIISWGETDHLFQYPYSGMTDMIFDMNFRFVSVSDLYEPTDEGHESQVGMTYTDL